MIRFTKYLFTAVAAVLAVLVTASLLHPTLTSTVLAHAAPDTSLYTNWFLTHILGTGQDVGGAALAMGVLASVSSSTYTPDRLVAGELPLLSKKVTLLSGENRARGAVLGRVAGAVTTAAGAGNTGNGTFAATPTVGAGVKEGVYRLTCIEPAANAGTFVLEDPDGIEVGRVTVAVAFAGQLAFTLNDGATDFVAGDFFTITVATGTKYKLAVAAATDGSHLARAILAEACDASAADTECMVYTRGDFNEAALVFGAGHTADTVREDLRIRNLHLVKTQGA